MYQSNRLAFGIKIAPAIFQQVMDTALRWTELCSRLSRRYFTEKWKPRNPKKKYFRGFQQDLGLSIQAERRKCDFFMNKIKYLGQIIDKNGRRPDPVRASAIKDMPAPKNVSSW